MPPKDLWAARARRRREGQTKAVPSPPHAEPAAANWMGLEWNQRDARSSRSKLGEAVHWYTGGRKNGKDMSKEERLVGSLLPTFPKRDVGEKNIGLNPITVEENVNATVRHRSNQPP